MLNKIWNTLLGKTDQEDLGEFLGEMPEERSSITLQSENLPDEERRMAVVAEIAGDGLVWVVPRSTAAAGNLNLGAMLDLVYRRDKDLPWRLPVIVELISSGTIPGSGQPVVRLGMRPVGIPRRLQRRNFVRLEFHQTLTYSEVRIPDSYCNDLEARNSALLGWRTDVGRAVHFGRLKDISGGGIAMITRRPVEIGHELFIEIPMGKETLRTAGRVVRSESSVGERKVGVQFMGIEKELQERIARFVAEEESKNRRRF